MKKIALKSIIFLFMAIFTGVTFFACNDDDEKEERKDNCKICGVTNPLTELDWLRTKVVEFSTSEEKAQIYTCIYQNDKQWFLITDCVE